MTKDADPIGRLFSFHHEIRRAMAELRELAASRELARHQRQLARKLVEFFMGPFFDHDHDEEAIFLPRLRSRVSKAEHLEALRLVSEDHDRMESELDEITQTLRGIEDGSLLQLRALDAMVKRLIHVVEPHLAMEERDLFPLARKCLDSDELREMNRELDQRAALRARGQRAVVRLIATKGNA